MSRHITANNLHLHLHLHLTPNVGPENYCDLPGSQENVKRVGKRFLFEDLATADALLAGRAWFFDHFPAVDAVRDTFGSAA